MRMEEQFSKIQNIFNRAGSESDETDKKNIRARIIIGAGILIVCILALGIFIWQKQFSGAPDVSSEAGKLNVLTALGENSTVTISAEEKYKILKELSGSSRR